MIVSRLSKVKLTVFCAALACGSAARAATFFYEPTPVSGSVSLRTALINEQEANYFSQDYDGGSSYADFADPETSSDARTITRLGGLSTHLTQRVDYDDFPDHIDSPLIRGETSSLSQQFSFYIGPSEQKEAFLDLYLPYNFDSSVDFSAVHNGRYLNFLSEAAFSISLSVFALPVFELPDFTQKKPFEQFTVLNDRQVVATTAGSNPFSEPRSREVLVAPAHISGERVRLRVDTDRTYSLHLSAACQLRNFSYSFSRDDFRPSGPSRQQAAGNCSAAVGWGGIAAFTDTDGNALDLSLIKSPYFPLQENLSGIPFTPEPLAVPEPSTWLLLTASFWIVGATLRRSRRRMVRT